MIKPKTGYKQNPCRKDDNADDVKETFSPEDNSETPVAKVMATPVTGKLTLPLQMIA